TRRAATAKGARREQGAGSWFGSQRRGQAWALVGKGHSGGWYRQIPSADWPGTISLAIPASACRSFGRYWCARLIELSGKGGRKIPRIFLGDRCSIFGCGQLLLCLVPLVISIGC
ncbi:unnamed protein product, partial [Ectocarpus sp. 12 AP-2014]